MNQYYFLIVWYSMAGELVWKLKMFKIKTNFHWMDHDLHIRRRSWSLELPEPLYFSGSRRRLDIFLVAGIGARDRYFSELKPKLKPPNFPQLRIPAWQTCGVDKMIMTPTAQLRSLSFQKSVPVPTSAATVTCPQTIQMISSRFCSSCSF